MAFSIFIQKVEKNPDEFRPNVPIDIRTNGDYAEFKGQLKASNAGEVFRTTGLIDSAILEKLNKAGLAYQISRESEGGFWQQLLVTWLPDGGAGRAVPGVHAPAAGRRRQGDELRQVEGQAALREPAAASPSPTSPASRRPRTRSRRSSPSSRTRRSSPGWAAASPRAS